MHLVRHPLNEIVDRPRSLVPASCSAAMAARVAMLLHADGKRRLHALKEDMAVEGFV